MQTGAYPCLLKGQVHHIGVENAVAFHTAVGAKVFRALRPARSGCVRLNFLNHCASLRSMPSWARRLHKVMTVRLVHAIHGARIVNRVDIRISVAKGGMQER